VIDAHEKHGNDRRRPRLEFAWRFGSKVTKKTRTIHSRRLFSDDRRRSPAQKSLKSNCGFHSKPRFLIASTIVFGIASPESASFSFRTRHRMKVSTTSSPCMTITIPSTSVAMPVKCIINWPSLLAVRTCSQIRQQFVWACCGRLNLLPHSLV
jgi:hypothetical protein